MGIAGSALLLSNLRALEAENELLHAELAQLDALIGSLEGGPDAHAALQERLEAIYALRDNTGHSASLLVALETAVPAGAWLTSLSIEGDRVDLHGEAADLDAAANLMEALQFSECFTDVALKSSESSPDGQTFWLQARPSETVCAEGRPGGRPLFLSPNLEDALRPDATIHPLVRWEPREYDLVGLEIGAATLRAPDESLHRVMVNGAVGRGRARVTFITDDSIVLTEDVLLDRDTQKTKTNIVTLRLVE